MTARRTAALVAGSTLALLALPFAGAAEAAPADGRTIYGVTSNGNRLISFPANSPASAAPVAGGFITGLGSGERIVGIDFRPANGLLYAVTSNASGTITQSSSGAGRIYTINLTTAAATPVATAAAFTLSGAFFDIDFNPVPNALRIVSSNGQNLRITNANGDLATAFTDTSLDYPDSDVNGARTPRVAGIAYTPLVNSASTLYDVDYAADALSIQNPPNNGTLNTVGPLGTNVTNLLGFDIEKDGTAYATAQTLDADQASSSATQLFTVDLATGALTARGEVEDDLLDSIAISLADPAPTPVVPELPLTALAPLSAAGILGVIAFRRRRAGQPA